MKTRDAEKFMLRLPDGLRSRIKTNAAINRRSMNSEIIFYLEKAVSSETKEISEQASA